MEGGTKPPDAHALTRMPPSKLLAGRVVPVDRSAVVRRKDDESVVPHRTACGGGAPLEEGGEVANGAVHEGDHRVVPASVVVVDVPKLGNPLLWYL